MKYLVKSAALFAVLSASVFAENTTSTATLETVVVTAARSEQAEVITPNSVNVITRKELDVMASDSLVDILQAQSGVQVSDFIGNGSRAAISLRGFGANAANNTLILIDGRKLNNPSIESPLLSAISVGDIERIEIIEGSGGVLYGDQAVGGVINIITKKAHKDPYYHVETTIGSDELLTLRGTASQIFKNGFGYRISAEDKTTDNYRDNNKSDYKNYVAKLEQNFDIGEVFVEFQKIDDELRLPGSLTQAQVDTYRRQTTSPSDYSNRETDVYRLGGTFNINDHWKVLAELSNRDTNGYGILLGSSFDQNTRVKSFSPRIIGNIESSAGTAHLTMGYDLQKSDYQYSTTNIWGSPKDSNQDMEAFYAQLIYPIIPKLHLTIGARESSVEFEDIPSAIKNNDSETTTEIGLSWNLEESTRLFIRSAEIIRFANADENGLTLPGVPYLDAQTGRSNEAGLEINKNLWSLRLTAFDMEVDNEIYFDSFQFANINLPNSERTGISVSGDYKVTPSITAAASYTFTDTEITEGSFSGNEVPFVSENLGSASVTWQITPSVSFYTDAIYTGSRYKYDDDANTGSRINSYCVHNLAVRWQHQNLSVSARLNNITGEEYSTLLSIWDYQYTAPEETFELTIGYTF